MIRVSGNLLVGVAPDVEVALGRAGRRVPRALEPRMLVRGVVDDQLDQHPDAPFVGARSDQRLEVVERAVARMDVQVVGDVVAVVPERRGEERQQPQAGDAEALQVVELLGQPREVADAVVVAVEERLDVRLVDDRVLVPERIGVCGGRGGVGGQAGRSASGSGVSVATRCVPAGCQDRSARSSTRRASCSALLVEQIVGRRRRRRRESERSSGTSTQPVLHVHADRG